MSPQFCDEVYAYVADDLGQTTRGVTFNFFYTAPPRRAAAHPSTINHARCNMLQYHVRRLLLSICISINEFALRRLSSYSPSPAYGSVMLDRRMQIVMKL